MAEDREVLRSIWSGQIPICFQLSSEETISFQKPDPVYIMCSRISYFPLVMDKAIKYFSRFVEQSKQQGTDLWIEYEDRPIKWHLPIGLSYDLVNDGTTTLPWNLIVHFDNFPDDKLVRCNNRALIQSLFMSTLKESDTLKHRSQIVSSMQKKEHNQMWHGLQDDKFDQFWKINKKLMEHANNELFRFIPFRIYQPDQPSFTQRPFKPIAESGEYQTLGDLVRFIFPDSFSEFDGEECDIKIVTHGIEPPFSTPLQWMSEHLSYPDNFLHLCAFPKR
ncbi:autophagy protein 5 [Brevipalpus obovatus]|uniref:autophagy protein 5 n=1 Tax=Brevipalpus obovatus TaxID=246614 RepID=UPI003D9E57D9